jgi:hypothetical protein
MDVQGNYQQMPCETAASDPIGQALYARLQSAANLKVSSQELLLKIGAGGTSSG